MTNAEMNELFALLDNVWEGLDEGREAGYRWLLEDEPADVVMAAVREMAQEDRHWLPRAPELVARVRQVQHRRAEDARLRALVARAGRVALPAGQDQPQLPPGEDA